MTTIMWRLLPGTSSPYSSPCFSSCSSSEQNCRCSAHSFSLSCRRRQQSVTTTQPVLFHSVTHRETDWLTDLAQEGVQETRLCWDNAKPAHLCAACCDHRAMHCHPGGGSVDRATRGGAARGDRASAAALIARRQMERSLLWHACSSYWWAGLLVTEAR